MALGLGLLPTKSDKLVWLGDGQRACEKDFGLRSTGQVSSL